MSTPTTGPFLIPSVTLTKVTTKHFVCKCKQLKKSKYDKTSEISSDKRVCASVRAASRNTGRTNNSLTCVVADSGITSYSISTALIHSFSVQYTMHQHFNSLNSNQIGMHCNNVPDRISAARMPYRFGVG